MDESKTPDTRTMVNDLLKKLDNDDDLDHKEKIEAKAEELAAQFGGVMNRIGYGDITKGVMRLVAMQISAVERKRK